MDKLEIARALIDDAIEEKRRIAKVDADIEKLNKKYPERTGNYYNERWKIKSQFGREPKKSHVNDNIKTARRLLMDGRMA